WLFPWLTWAVILFISGALAVMMFTEEHRAEVTATLSLAIVISFLGIVTTRGHSRRAVGARSLG
ncbi:MAG: GABA permease, partial [Pseudomonas sp.]|nr:GABA permease [Pseudomonas sp.]